ncbi:hypothetical protein Ga0451573_003564 [Peptococcaceae bacterium DYL19]|nr:hypothetical protein [Phosphitispora fastidiosa]
MFNSFLSPLSKANWVVYCKPPFAGPEKVLQYLGQYTHRVAISNNRIINVEDSKVTFKWRDYRDNNKTKLMTLGAQEFIRRFLLHILPQRFVRIRHYGILSNRNRNTKLNTCKHLFKLSTSRTKITDIAELLLKLTGRDITLCPQCGKGKINYINFC